MENVHVFRFSVFHSIDFRLNHFRWIDHKTRPRPMRSGLSHTARSKKATRPISIGFNWKKCRCQNLLISGGLAKYQLKCSTRECVTRYQRVDTAILHHLNQLRITTKHQKNIVNFVARENVYFPVCVRAKIVMNNNELIAGDQRSVDNKVFSHTNLSHLIRKMCACVFVHFKSDHLSVPTETGCRRAWEISTISLQKWFWPIMFMRPNNWNIDCVRQSGQTHNINHMRLARIKWNESVAKCAIMKTTENDR